MNFTKEQENFIETLLSETGFEIWNAGCTHRLNCNLTNEKRFAVCEHDDPLHPVKEYVNFAKAIEFMIKRDEE